MKNSARRMPRAVAGVMALAAVQSAHAVSLSGGGQGQALIYPYYTVQGSHDTLLSIVNSNAHATALKVRFREARNSRVVLDFNLYLGARASWTAMVTRGPSEAPVLRTWDAACTVPQFPASTVAADAKDMAFTNADYANYDRAGSGLDRAREGFFEVIEMGVIDDFFILTGNKSFKAAVTIGSGNSLTGTQDCAAVAAAWQPGGRFLTSQGAEVARPGGGLFGMGTLIDVPRGMDYSFDPVALINFTATPRHTAPGSVSPSLADADPESVVLRDPAPLAEATRVSTWDNGIDAVSAVLTHWAVRNEYIANTPTLEAATDVILTFPTKSFYVVRESDTGQSTRAPFSAKFDDVAPAGNGATGSLLPDGSSQGACELINMISYARDGRFNGESHHTVFNTPAPQNPGYACWASSVLSYDNALGSASAIGVNAHQFTKFGSFEIRFSVDPFVRLVSKEGHIYTGKPVVGFVAQKYVNGNLGGLLSNYGGVLVHKYTDLSQ